MDTINRNLCLNFELNKSDIYIKTAKVFASTSAITVIGATILSAMTITAVVSMPLIVPIGIGVSASVVFIASLFFMGIKSQINFKEFVNSNIDKSCGFLDLKKYGNSIDDKFIDSVIHHFPNLLGLSIHSNRVTSQGLKNLNSLNNLKSIVLRCPELTEINLKGCKNLIKCDFSHCDKLKTIIFFGCENLNLLNLTHCPQVESLDLSGRQNLELLNLLGCNLKKIDLSGCEKLRDLDLSNHRELTDFCLNRCVELSTLDLTGCCELTKVHLENQKLSVLYIDGCDKITELNYKESRNLRIIYFNNWKNLESLEAASIILNSNYYIELLPHLLKNAKDNITVSILNLLFNAETGLIFILPKFTAILKDENYNLELKNKLANLIKGNAPKLNLEHSFAKEIIPRKFFTDKDTLVEAVKEILSKEKEQLEKNIINFDEHKSNEKAEAEKKDLDLKAKKMEELKLFIDSHPDGHFLEELQKEENSELNDLYLSSIPTRYNLPTF